MRVQFWISTVLAFAAIILAITNAALFSGNRTLQTEISRRAHFTQQSMQFEGLFNEMVRALAELSARKGDEELKQLLEGVGITYTIGRQTPPSTPAGSR